MNARVQDAGSPGWTVPLRQQQQVGEKQALDGFSPGSLPPIPCQTARVRHWGPGTKRVAFLQRGSGQEPSGGEAATQEQVSGLYNTPSHHALLPLSWGFASAAARPARPVVVVVDGAGPLPFRRNPRTRPRSTANAPRSTNQPNHCSASRWQGKHTHTHTHTHTIESQAEPLPTKPHRIQKRPFACFSTPRLHKP